MAHGQPQGQPRATVTPMAAYARAMDLSGRDGAFSAAQALYWHCADYHEGQGSERYRILSQLGYRPGASERGPEADSVAEVMYADLAAGGLDPEDVRQWIDAEWAKAGD